MEIWVKALTVVLWCMFKYAVGVISAITFNFSFPETFMSTVGGGMLGVVIYLYLWEAILFVWRKFFPKKPKSGGIKMNKRKRWMVTIIRKYEIYGIAALTPILLSVPVGTLLAAAIEPNKWHIKVYMFLSFILWTCLIYGLYKMFGIRIDQLF